MVGCDLLYARSVRSGSRLRGLQGRSNGQAPLRIGREDPRIDRGFFFCCIRVVKLGAEALDVNAMTPGRCCPASLLTGCSPSPKPRFLALTAVDSDRLSASRRPDSVFHFALHQVE